MKLLLITTLMLSSISYSNELSVDIIKNPSVSRRCKALIKDRNQKVLVSQKLSSLIRRNTSLVKKLKLKEKLAFQKLKINKQNLKRQLSLATLQISKMEENIVRSGCPGISL